MSSIDRYEGLCITGPWDGKMVARDTSTFRVPLGKPLELFEVMGREINAEPLPVFCYYWTKVGNAGFWTPHGWTAPSVMVALCQRYVRNSSEELRDAYTQQALADGRRNDPLAR